MSQSDTAPPIWRAISGRPERLGEPERDPVGRLAGIISAAGAAALLPGAAALLDDAEVRQSRLLNRFRRKQGEQWAARLTEAGIGNAAIKGLASAHTLWPDPDARAVSDADILIRPADLHDALALFRDAGFVFGETPTRGPWGFVGDASFQPLIGPGDGANIDLHVQGDAHPFGRALPVDEILASARDTPVPGVKAPAPGHALLIAASHAAGDLFGRDALKSVVDGLLLMRRADRIDFADLARRCARGRMTRPVSAFLALLEKLGAEAGPARDGGFDLERVQGAAFRRVAEAHLDVFADRRTPGLLDRLRLEAALATEPPILLYRNWRRLTGLVRPRKGLPPAPAN